MRTNPCHGCRPAAQTGPVPDRPRVPAATALAGPGVATGMLLFVLAVYLLVVLGGGALLGTPPPSLPLAVFATAVVAVTFEPVRGGLRRRLLTTPYDVLSEFATQVSATVMTQDVAPRMARLLAEGTSARRVEVWLVHDGSVAEQHLAARWPAGSASIDPSGPGVRCHDVVHDGVLLGRILRDTDGVSAHGGGLNPIEQRLLVDLLSSAGLALRTVALTAGLQHRIAQSAGQAAEVQASRQRIVTTADAARQRLERDIHDGAQQHLVALAVNLSLAATLAGRDPVRAAELVDDLRLAAEAALATLDDLCRGICPRPLTEAGLVAALRAAAATSPVPVHVLDATTGRPAADVEAALYYSCLEAVQNAVKHAAASAVEVRLSERDSCLVVQVRDDGVGFDPAAVREGAGLGNMRDRVESLGGELALTSRPGAGTTVTSRIPVPSGTAVRGAGDD
jgi:signal transduction histidine kinase